jgi:hypothetical protein
VSSNLDKGEVSNIKICQWLVTGHWFSAGHPVSYTNKTDRHDITEILLKVTLNTIKHLTVIFMSTIVWYMLLYNFYLLCSQSAISPLATCVTCEFGARSWRGVLDTTMRYNVCQLHCSRLVGFFRNWRNPFYQINKHDRHDITYIYISIHHFICMFSIGSFIVTWQ